MKRQEFVEHVVRQMSLERVEAVREAGERLDAAEVCDRDDDVDIAAGALQEALDPINDTATDLYVDQLNKDDEGEVFIAVEETLGLVVTLSEVRYQALALVLKLEGLGMGFVDDGYLEQTANELHRYIQSTVAFIGTELRAAERRHEMTAFEVMTEGLGRMADDVRRVQRLVGLEQVFAEALQA